MGDRDTIKQLVYKRYLTKSDTRIAENSYFKQQLFNDLQCKTITIKDVEHIDYRKSDLERFIVKYNKCSNNSYVYFKKKQKRDIFGLSIRPGLNYTILSVENPLAVKRTSVLPGEINFRFGLETEFILPFNKNKWTILVEPNYQYFESKQKIETTSVALGGLILTVDYKSIELPLGLRHSFFIKGDAKVFVNVSYVFDFSFDSSVEFTRLDGSTFYSPIINAGNNLALGVGYKYKNKYSLELRYQTNRRIATGSEYQITSMMLGYSIF